MYFTLKARQLTTSFIVPTLHIVQRSLHKRVFFCAMNLVFLFFYFLCLFCFKHLFTHLDFNAFHVSFENHFARRLKSFKSK